MASARAELRAQRRSATPMLVAPTRQWALITKSRRLATTWGAWPVRTCEVSSA
ncbi:hypothetical protein [Nocardia vaccinii]|uniref:hypothetical protein n=1 Tax=Nocardia vaccinii TaxID=1822 RepID=UPI0012F49AFF|nr:hypothetical protein [Nocardia vaccinii]